MCGNAGRSVLSSQSNEVRPALIWRLAPWIILTIVTLVKLRLLLPYAQSPAGSDELRYLEHALSLASGNVYDDPHFPPMFSLLLVPGLLLSDVYRASIGLICLYSSALVLPVWLIVREMIDERAAAAAAAVAAILPFQYSMARVVMSETVFYPLLLLALYLVTTERWTQLRWRDALTGLVIAALYLTRYMVAVFLPAMGLVWLLRERRRLGSWRPDRDLALRFVIMLVVAAVLIGSWSWAVATNAPAGADALQVNRVANMLTPSILPAKALTTSRFLKFGLAYLASWTLWLAPILGVILLGLMRMIKRPSADMAGRFGVLLIAMATPLWFVASRWAWRANYNWPDVLRIMDRYCIYLVAIGIVFALGVAGRWFGDGGYLGPVRHWVIGVGIPAVIIPAAWWVVFKWGFLPPLRITAPGYATADTYHVLAMGHWFWPVVGASLFAGAWATQRRRNAFGTLVACLLVFYAIGIPTYVKHASVQPVAHAHALGITPAVMERSYETTVVVGFSPKTIEESGSDRLPRQVWSRLSWLTGRDWWALRLREMSDRPPGDGLRVYVSDELTGTPSVVGEYTVGDTSYVVVER